MDQYVQIPEKKKKEVGQFQIMFVNKFKTISNTHN